MEKDIKVLFITCDSSLFGANKSLLNIISSVKSELNSFCVVTPYHGEFNDLLDSFNIHNKVIRFNSDCAIKPTNLITQCKFILKFFKFKFKNILAKKELQSFIKANGFNIIHSNSGVISIGNEIAQLMKIKHIWHLREFIDKDHGMIPFIGFEKYVKKINSTDFIICVSYSISNHFDTQKAITTVMYNAVINKNSVTQPIPYILDNRNVNNYFLYCGSFTQNKGIEDALLAFYFFKKNMRSSDIKLKLAGAVSSDSKYLSKILNLIDQLNLKNHVEMLGYVKDIFPIMNTSIALLVCSKNEALGRVTVEAMANYCIVIGYNNAGTSELIKDYETGFLYTSTQELYEKMNHVYNNSQNLLEIKKQAFEFSIANFSEEIFKDKISHIYTKLLL